MYGPLIVKANNNCSKLQGNSGLIICLLNDLKKACGQVQVIEGAMSFTVGLYFPRIISVLRGG